MLWSFNNWYYLFLDLCEVALFLIIRFIYELLNELVDIILPLLFRAHFFIWDIVVIVIRISSWSL